MSPRDKPKTKEVIVEKKEESKPMQFTFASVIPLIVVFSAITGLVTSYMTSTNNIDKRITVAEIYVEANKKAIKAVKTDIRQIKNHLMGKKKEKSEDMLIDD